MASATIGLNFRAAWHYSSGQNPGCLSKRRNLQAKSRWSNGGSNTPTTSAPSVADRREISREVTTQGDAKPCEVLALCSPRLGSPPGDVVERALAVGLVEAAVAGRFDVVAQLARELEARRLERAERGAALEAPRWPDSGGDVG
jgi:hypothetical protein